MESQPEQIRPEAALDESSRLALEQAQVSDDKTRLKLLDDLYETLEANLDEDASSRP